MSSNLTLEIPSVGLTISPGNHIRLGRFDNTVWLVNHGWYSYGGNRPICGWYLQNIQKPEVVKPIHPDDLDDCYLIEA